MTATPFFFGGERRLFGWLHEPDTAVRRNTAVLLCQPFGHEYICAHRSVRWLAERLSAAGFTALRFDYAGTGNSAATPPGSSMLPAWEQSIDIAADELVARSDCDQIAMIGIRFGATLAALAAARRGDVASLVLAAPCTSGRSYIRQTRILGANAAARPEDVAHEDGTIEAAGFAFDPLTAAAISSISVSFDRPPAPRALVLDRDDLPDPKFVAALAEAGVECDEERCSGYADFMRSPVHSALPLAALQYVTRWLSAEHTCQCERPRNLRSGTRAIWNGIREEPVRVGEISGIITRATRGASEPSGVILLNTGGDHHVGPHGLYTGVARDWAATGFSVLRMDLRGLGDSGDPGDASRLEVYPETALADVESAVTYMRDVGCSDVTVAGMCSGGFHALHAAARVPVDGVIAVNAPLYWQPGDSLDDDPHAGVDGTLRTGRSALSPSKWLKLLRGGVDISEHARNLKTAAIAAGTAIAERLHRSPAHAERVTGLLPAGVQTSLIFSDADPALRFFHTAFASRMRELESRPDFKLDVVRGADHTFMGRSWQRTLVALMTARLEEQRARRAASAV